MESIKVYNKLLLSFIVPVYNVEKYLKDCLDSLLCQDIDKSLYEIICINDGSLDNSLEILKDYESKSSNIKVIDKVNEGVSATRNLGIEKANGEYIWFVDADDYIAPNVLGGFKKIVEDMPLDVVKVDFSKVSESSFFDSTKEGERISLSKVGQIINGPYVWNSIIRRSILEENNIRFNPSLAYGEDALFHYYVWIYANKEKVALVDSKIYRYRMRGDSATGNADVEKMTRRVNCFFEIARTYKRECERRIIEDDDILLKTKHRQNLAVMNGLTFLPASNLDWKETIESLSKEGLYPFPFMWWHIKGAGGLKGKIGEFLRNLFKFKLVYFIYYKLAVKTGIISKFIKKI